MLRWYHGAGWLATYFFSIVQDLDTACVGAFKLACPRLQVFSAKPRARSDWSSRRSAFAWAATLCMFTVTTNPCLTTAHPRCVARKWTTLTAAISCREETRSAPGGTQSHPRHRHTRSDKHRET